MREAPVAPRHGEIPLFASSALLIQENLDLLMAIRSQRHEEAIHHVCQRLPKNGTGTEKNTDFPRFTFKLDFRCLLYRFRCQKYQECARNDPKNTKFLESMSEVKSGVSTAPARADRGSGPSRNYKKRKIITTCEPSRSGCRCFTEHC